MKRIHLLSFVIVCLAQVGFAQCAPEWRTGFGRPGIAAAVSAATWWDPDGSSPLNGPQLVVGGSFTDGGRNRIARWDGRAWRAFGDGFNGTVTTLAVMPNGDLIAGGNFTHSGSTLVNHIARWSGASWQPLLAGLDDQPDDLLAMPNGDLIVGGRFTTAGGAPALRIARWNGATWSTFGSGMNNVVHKVRIAANGDLIAAGIFTVAGGTLVNRIARWNGSSWSGFGTGMDFRILGLAIAANGDVVAGGEFTTAGGSSANHLARWDGAAWQELGSGVNDDVEEVVVLPNGEVVASGDFTFAGSVVNGGSAARIASWDGSDWHAFGSGTDAPVTCLEITPGGEVFAAGGFEHAGGVAAESIAFWDGVSWQALANGVSGDVRTVTAAPGGGFYVGGIFGPPGSSTASNVAHWDGTSWLSLGSGTGGGLNGSGFSTSGNVESILPTSTGDLVVGGWFASAGGSPANSIARWDGAQWHALGSGGDDIVRKVIELPNGDLVAGGWINFMGGVPVRKLARWDGSAWSMFAGGVFCCSSGAAVVDDLLQLPNGDILVCGRFGAVGNSQVPATNIARWDGTDWHAMGAGLDDRVLSMTYTSDGDVVAGGAFQQSGATVVNHLARWDGSSWLPVGGGTDAAVRAVHELPNGDSIVVGDFATAGVVAASGVARWNGSSWSGVAGGASDIVLDMVGLDQSVCLVGRFSEVGDIASEGIALLDPSCPAAVLDNGGGCPSSGGANQLVANGLPWIGTTFETTGTGLPLFAFVANVIGFAPSFLPLSVVFPAGQPGCNLLVAPTVIDIGVSTAGSFATSLVLPNSVSLAGSVLQQQLVPMEVDASLSFTAITATNSLSVTVGAF